MIAHCENMGDRMAILDAPPNMIPQDILDWRMNAAGYDSKFAALYYPWLEVMDPITKRPLLVPPSGHVAGVWARTDGTRGVHKAPANEVTIGVNGLGFQVTRRGAGRAEPARASTASARSPAAASASGAPARCRATPSGATSTSAACSTTSRSRSWKGTQWAVFEPNDERLWSSLRISADELPHPHVAAGRAVRRDAGAGVLRQVRRRDEPAGRDRGRPGRRSRSGSAPVKPAEFVIFRISQFAAGASEVA